ncbi:AAA-like domain-containing protein [Sorangium sp. So ce131]|uniref:AAA-like domain-containing protein n=1 Tax=Sorangium sp. So ce131 TaxID=3133282 RepID=UPI003F5DC59E
MPVEPRADPLVAQLRGAYEQGNLIAFVGAEVSAAAGLPTREQLARALIERLRGRADVVAEVEEFVERRAYLSALSAAAAGLGKEEFGSAVEEALRDDDVELPEVVVALAALRPRLRAVLTTNLDHLLERAFGWQALPSTPADIAERRQIIVKLHGTLLDQGTWVFSRRHVERAVLASPDLQDGLAELFHACPVLFVGCSFVEDDLEQIFQQMRALAGEQPPARYALLPRESLTPFRTRVLQEAGLLLLPYAGQGGMRAEVPAILRSLLPPISVSTWPPQPTARYVHRLREEHEALSRFEEGAPVVLMGPDRFGKTTLLQHLVARIRAGEKGPARVVEINLGHLGTHALETVDAWMTSFAACLVHELGSDMTLAEGLATSPVPWLVKLTRMVERHLFPDAPEHLVLAIDDADAAWGLPIQDDVFRLLRAWCELGGRKEPWSRFRLLLSLSSSPALLKDGPAESPWNIAPSIHLSDLHGEQLRELLRLHNVACTRDELRLLEQRVGGHPELVRLVVKRWRTSGEDLERVIAEEEDGGGALAEHLFAMGERLRQDPALVEGVCAILDDTRANVDPRVADRLMRAGVAEHHEGGYRIRFPLYERYLRRRWRPWLQQG